MSWLPLKSNDSVTVPIFRAGGEENDFPGCGDLKETVAARCPGLRPSVVKDQSPGKMLDVILLGIVSLHPKAALRDAVGAGEPPILQYSPGWFGGGPGAHGRDEGGILAVAFVHWLYFHSREIPSSR